MSQTTTSVATILAALRMIDEEGTIGRIENLVVVVRRTPPEGIAMRGPGDDGELVHGKCYFFASAIVELLISNSEHLNYLHPRSPFRSLAPQPPVET